MSEHESIGRSLLDETVEASPVVLFALRRSDAGLVPVWMCPNVRRILDLSPVTPDHPGWWTDAVHPDDRSRVERARTGVGRDDPQRFEFRLKDGDGRYRWLREEVRAPDTESGEVDAVGSWSDVTAVRRLEERVRRAGRMEAVGRFAGGMAHEFNNLLTVIRGNADLLRSAVGDDSETASELAEIEEAAEVAQWMVTQLLAYSAEQDGELRAVDVCEEIRTAEPVLRELVGDEVDLRIEAAEATPTVMIDPAHVHQILTNLAANARDAMPGGGSLRVDVRVVSVDSDDRNHPDLMPGSYVAVGFEDSGEGMSETTQEKAFDPFFTTRDRGERTGLGLSTVYGMVRQAGGDVELESAPGEGTRVVIYLRAREEVGEERA